MDYHPLMGKLPPNFSLLARILGSLEMSHRRFGHHHINSPFSFSLICLLGRLNGNYDGLQPR